MNFFVESSRGGCLQLTSKYNKWLEGESGERNKKISSDELKNVFFSNFQKKCELLISAGGGHNEINSPNFLSLKWYPIIRVLCFE